METALSATFNEGKNTAVCSLWINDNNKIKFNCEKCPGRGKKGVCTHIMLMLHMLKKEV